MEIYLIRHTTPAIEKGICYGQTDLDLNTTFKEETKNIIAKIAINQKEKTVYSSPLKRCALLAQKISEVVIYDDRLKELDFGDWELNNWDAINQDDLNKWMNDFVNEQVPNGESYLQLYRRSISFFSEILTSNNKQTIIVTHAGVIRSLVAYILKMDLKDSFNIKLNYGAVVHLKYESEKVSIQSGVLIDNKFM